MYYCKWHIYFWFLIAILFLLGSCQEEEQSELNIYFDSAEYISKEVAQLEESVNLLKQKIVLNEKVEYKDSVISSPSSFEEMHNLFTQANINKGVFKSEYQLDTFWILDPITNENIEVLNYFTDNAELKVQWMQVYSNGSIKVSMHEENFLFSYEKEAYYEKASKFSVVSWQKSIGLDTLHIFKEQLFL